MSFWWKAKQAPLLINQWEKITIFCSDKTQEETAAEAAAEAAAVEAMAPEGAEPWMRHGSGIHWPMENQKKPKVRSIHWPMENQKNKYLPKYGSTTDSSHWHRRRQLHLHVIPQAIVALRKDMNQLCKNAIQN